MSQESDLLLSNLITSFRGHHCIYKEEYVEFSTWFFLMLLFLVVTPIFLLVAWWLDEAKMIQELNYVLWVFVIYGAAVLNLYFKVLKSKKRLNLIKQQLEGANFCICTDDNQANDMPLILTKEQIANTQFTLKPYTKIDFKLYNFHFKV